MLQRQPFPHANILQLQNVETCKCRRLEFSSTVMYFRSHCAAEQHVCEVTGKKTEMWFEPTIDSNAG